MSQVSIIIPVYNTEKYLRQCLESVINQTFKDIEIIVVNDCSKDNCLTIIKEYQLKDNRIILINLKNNVGLGFARNEGIKIAKGNYIVFIDSDDWVKKDYIETLFNSIEKYNLDVFATSFCLYDNKSTQTKIYKYSQFVTNCKNYDILLLTPSRICTPWARIYKKNFLIKNNIFFLLKSKEDSLFFYELILSRPKILFANIPMYFYRTNLKNSLTGNYYFTIHALIKLLKNIKILLIEKNLFKKYFKTFYIYSFLYIAYELTITKFSNKKIQATLLIINKYLNKNTICSNLFDKIIIFAFCFFLHHAIFYKITAKILRHIKRFIQLFLLH